MRGEFLNETELICSLSLTFGPSGCEDKVIEQIRQYASRYTQHITRDRLGNLICKMSFSGASSEKAKKIMLCAHTDEVGFMIDGITDEGMLTFGCVGGIDPSVMAGRRVLVGNEKQIFDGVICSKAIHHKDKDARKKALPADKLYIDIGVESREEAEKRVSIGDFATFNSEFRVFGKGQGMLKGKALDDRMGCAALLQIMQRLAQEPIDAELDLYFCFTVREEIGYSGALTSANAIKPDFAIVLETTAISDLPKTEEHLRVANVGHGVVISLADRATIYKRELADAAMRVAKDNNISAQFKRYVSGGNDAAKIQKALDGIDVLALSVPTRYLHSAACVAALYDYQTQRELVLRILKNINNFVED